MAYGLRVWDASGNLIVDASTRLGRIIGWIPEAQALSNGSITVPEFSEGTPFSLFLNPQAAVEFYSKSQPVGPYGFPVVTFSGNTMSWTYDANIIRQPVAIAYGVY